MNFILTAIQGFCMALADSIPGVSGGTIAFILGFYDKLINSLNYLITGTKLQRKQSIIFLLKLAVGWILGFVLSILILSNLFETNIYKMSSLFLGLSLFSLFPIIKDEKNVIFNHFHNIFFTLLGIIIVSSITYFNLTNKQHININTDHLSLILLIYIFFISMIAISAMILPGISGSTLLLIFGLYLPIVNAIKEFLHMNFTYLPILFAFGLGILTGIFTIIKLIKNALDNYRSQIIYFIMGLVIGSIYAIITGPTTLKIPQEPMNIHTFSIIFFLLGISILAVLEYLKKLLS